MNRLFRSLAWLAVLLAVSCAPVAAPAQVAQVAAVQYTSATQPWLPGLYDCAPENMVLAVELRSAAFADQEAALFLRVGEPGRWLGPAYQLGVEKLVVIVHPQNPLQVLGEAELLDLFTGQARSWPVTGAPVTVWAYAPGEDLSAAFDGLLLRGRPLASTARLAAGVEQMRDEVARDVNALGFTGQASAGEDVRILQTLGELPVLALTPREPDDLLRTLLACAQK